MAEHSEAQSTGQPPRVPHEDPEVGPSSQPMETQIQQLVANNQAMQEQMNTLKDAMQALLTRLPPATQEPTPQERPEQRDPLIETLHTLQVQSTTTPTMVYSQPQPMNTFGITFPTTSNAHGAMHQAPPPFTQMPVDPYWPSSSYMQPQGASGLFQPPYSAPHIAMWPGYAAAAATPSSSREPQTLQATTSTMACSHPHPPRITIGIANLSSLSATGVALQEPTLDTHTLESLSATRIVQQVPILKIQRPAYPPCHVTASSSVIGVVQQVPAPTTQLVYQQTQQGAFRMSSSSPTSSRKEIQEHSTHENEHLEIMSPTKQYSTPSVYHPKVTLIPEHTLIKPLGVPRFSLNPQSETPLKLLQDAASLDDNEDFATSILSGTDEYHKFDTYSFANTSRANEAHGGFLAFNYISAGLSISWRSTTDIHATSLRPHATLPWRDYYASCFYLVYRSSRLLVLVLGDIFQVPALRLCFDPGGVILF